ncbi:PPE family protein [Nocardia flavorosea]|nr:PPE domain-containing protein [Nocardia flavorosea]
MLTGDYYALPPEVNSARLTFGPGSAHLLTTSAAYSGMAEALNLAADGSDGSTNDLAVSWNGSSSDLAQAAFRRHASWLREQAEIAMNVARLADGGAAAYDAAFKAMPPLGLITANRAHAIELAAEYAVTSSSGLGVFTAAKIAVNETLYLGMWIQAASTMVAYDAAATTVTTALGALRPLPPPPITESGSGDSPTDIPTDPGSGPPPGGGTDGPAIGGTDGPGGQPTDLTQSPTESPTDLVQQNPSADQAISQVEQAMSSMNDSLADPGLGDAHSGALEQHGFYGTSPYSSTLSGLTGGMGSMVAVGMMRGGLGSMSGASTGFRLPANWSPAAGRAFGAGTGTPPVSAGNAAPRRGVSAPGSRMRRRRKDDEKEPAKVFVPGEQHDVPVLERPPEIGVIRYTEDIDERQDEMASDALLVGVLERFDIADAETRERLRRDTSN